MASIAYADISSTGSPHFTSAAKSARDALLSTGVIQIRGIPNFGVARETALKDLASCLDKDATSAFSMAMDDGSRRVSTAAGSTEGVASPFESYCGAASTELRKAVDLGTRHLFLALDTLVAQSSARADRTSMVMKPYKTYEELLRRGEHLEHLHAYFSSSSSTTRTSLSGAPGGLLTKTSPTPSNHLPTTMEFHTDGGMFIGMTTGYYQGQPATENSGLYIRKSDGATQKAVFDDDALIVLIGEAGARWLSPVLGSPLVATTHALVADLSTAADGTASTRAW